MELRSAMEIEVIPVARTGVVSETDNYVLALTTLSEALKKQLAPRSHQTYSYDSARMRGWFAAHGLDLEILANWSRLTRDDMLSYREYLGQNYARATAQRMWTVARRHLTEAVTRGW